MFLYLSATPTISESQVIWICFINLSAFLQSINDIYCCSKHIFKYHGLLLSRLITVATYLHGMKDMLPWACATWVRINHFKASFEKYQLFSLNPFESYEAKCRHLHNCPSKNLFSQFQLEIFKYMTLHVTSSIKNCSWSSWLYKQSNPLTTLLKYVSHFSQKLIMVAFKIISSQSDINTFLTVIS